MRRTEQDLWHAIRREDPFREFTRIESAVTATGISDVTYRTETRHGWIELKTCRRRARSAVWVPDHPLSVEQLAWIAKRNVPRWRLYSYVLLGMYHDGGRFDALALVPPRDAVALLGGARNATPRATWHVSDDVRGVLEFLRTYGKNEGR